MLDVPADQEFDSLARLAASILGTPMAQVNFIDGDLQQTRGAFGIRSGPIARTVSFCARTITVPDRVMVVPDTFQDPRFAGNPLVLGAPGIRFYAGAQILHGAGQPLGVLCVLDTKPRTLDPAALEMMSALARTASSRLEHLRMSAALKESEEHYRYAVALNPQIPWITSAEGEIIEVSPRWLSTMGMDFEAVRGAGWAEAVHPDDRPMILSLWRESVRTGNELDGEYRLRLASGEYRWFRVRASPRRDAAGRILRWYGTTEEIHDRKLAKLALKESEERLLFALEVGGLGAWEFDLLTGRLTGSDGYARNFGLRKASDLASYDLLLSLIHPDDRRRHDLTFEQALAERRNFEIELRIVWPDGSTHWLKVTGRAIYDEAGEPLRMVGLSQDVTVQRHAAEERRRAEEQMAFLATHDPLTGLANRRLLFDRLPALLKAAVSDKVALLLIDFDQFKAINDTFGHLVGDEVLRQAARRLVGSIRRHDLAVRQGGDEFAVVAPGVESEADVIALICRIQDSFNEPFQLDGRIETIGISIGVAVSVGIATDPDELHRQADIALYNAKSERRGSYRFYRDSMGEALKQRQLLRLDLRRALARRELSLVYQPLVELETGRVAGFEALLRWTHPRRGAISPAEFIPIAEESGDILEIGRWVLREACREAASWPAGVDLAVNLSPRQLTHDDVEAAVRVALSESGLRPERLELEITESVLLEEDKVVAETLSALQEHGVRLAVDDFGTGYSALGYLRRFSFNKIKIDRSLIRDLPDRGRGDAILRAITAMSRSLGVVTVGEGVETAEQLALLRNHGCTQAQGFLPGRPMPASEIQSFLGTYRLRDG